jgi:hypothetical protein
VGTWAARTPWRHAQGREGNGQARSYIGNTLLCAASLAILLVFGDVEQNPGPVVEQRTFYKYRVVGVRGISNRVHSATRVDDGFTTAVAM